MTQRPLELPGPTVLRLAQGDRPLKEERAIVRVIVAQQTTGPNILHVEPTGREANNGDREFPTIITAIGG